MSEQDAINRLAPVFALIERFVGDGEIDGAALAVAQRGELVAEWYVARAASDLPSGPSVLWPLASISKLYTAAMVMALVERGTLTLAMPVHTLLPEFSGDGREKVRLRHLLTHTSGLIYESPNMEQLLRARTPYDEIIDEAYGHPLLFKPGSGFEYSDYGIALAGRMASVATGMPFPDLIRTLVLEPGELENTFMPPPASLYARVAHVKGTLGYGTDGAMYNSPYALQLAHPAFGTVASVTDLLRFALLFAPNSPRRILSAATIRAITSDQTGGMARGHLAGIELALPQPWGLGFELNSTAGGFGLAELGSRATFGHAGASGCTVMVDPLNDLALAYVSNGHANINMDRWYYRLSSVTNAVYAALSE
ncbi:MAG TPA: serine hydrolase domain-containing protein [Nitrolancea sp.]|nr:serine hydrolase domain-containing protein [Nitrolancea sp.]